MEAWMGVDVHHGGYALALVGATPQEGSPPRLRSLGTRRISCDAAGFGELEAWLQAMRVDPGELHVAFDAAGALYALPLVRFLQAKGCGLAFIQPSVARTAKEVLGIERRKTDDLDASTFARLLYLRQQGAIDPKLVPLAVEPNLEASLAAGLVRLRWALVTSRTQATNRLHGLV